MVSQVTMRTEVPTRRLLIIALTSALALGACGRKSETHDPDTAAPADTPATTEQTTEGATLEDERSTTEADDNNTGAASATGDDNLADSTPDTSSEVTEDKNTDAASATGDDPNSEGQLICTPEWFEWVNTQVMATNSEEIAEQYPTGLPEVGTDEWFLAVDKLTGGDGAHGPDGGSDEWCFMMQQRLPKPD